MKCPHCAVAFHENVYWTLVEQDVDGVWMVERYNCPECGRASLYLVSATGLIHSMNPAQGPDEVLSRTPIRPKGAARPLPPQVPADLAGEFEEACAVLPDSAKASAALSRRLLQRVLREKAEVKPGNLSDEIDEVLKAGGLPTAVADALDAVREIGNFAAHPMKSKSMGEVLPVEPQEAEWNLEVLELLFDHYYVVPDKIAQRKAALNAKLKDAGRREV